MTSIIIVTGTPGAGKTTVLQGALEKIKNDTKVVSYAKVMLSLGADLGIGDDHDAIRKQPLEVQRDLQKKAAEKIASEADGVTIVDTHTTIRTKNGYLPGLPEWIVKALSPQVIVVVEANPDEIVGRRKADKTRSRDAETVKGVELHQQINRAAAIVAASACGATVKIVKNRNDKLDEAVDDMVKLLEVF